MSIDDAIANSIEKLTHSTGGRFAGAGFGVFARPSAGTVSGPAGPADHLNGQGRPEG